MPEELVKLHKDIYLTADMLFVNVIPLFLTLIRKICFAAVKHLSNRNVETIFKTFKYIYSYYMKLGSISQITMQMKNLTHYKIWSTSTCQGGK